MHNDTNFTYFSHF